MSNRRPMPDVLVSTSPALLNGATCFDVACLVAQGAEDAVQPLRAALRDGCRV